MPARKKRKSFPLKSLLILAVILVLGAVGFYSYQQFKTSGIEQEGIVVCNREGICEKSLHVHSGLQISVCGEEKSLAKDTGELADIHTHKQSTVLHFHERLRVTPTGEVLDWTPLKLGNAVERVTGMRLSDECIGDFCNGDLCPNGRRGKVKLTVVENFCSRDVCPGADEAQRALKEQGKPRDNIADYVWKDGDLLNLTFE